MNYWTSLPKFGRSLCGSMGLVGLLSCAHLSSARAKTFVIPHLLEKSGSIATSNYTFDTTLVLTYNGTLNGTDKNFAEVQLYLYDEQTGKLMQGLSNTICGPCGFELSSQSRKLSIKLDDLISGPGGGFDSDMKLGFAVLVISGPGADAVNLQGFVVNSHTGPFDVSVFGFEPHEPPPPLSGGPQIRRSFVLPHVLESSGRALSTSNAIDTVLYATYTGALTGMPEGTGASLDLYLYDQATGKAMVGGKGADVCNPCSFDLGTGAAGAAQRKRTIDFDDLITAAGGFGGANLKQGYAIVSVGGADPSGVELESFVVNSHTGPFDVSVFASKPNELHTNNPASTKRPYVIPHVLEKSGLVSTQTFTFDSILYATYSSGLAGLPDGQGARLDLYLYDDSGALMRGAQAPICDPCSFGLGSGPAGTANPRKQSIRIDDLIMTRGGGFDTDTKSGFGVLVAGGSDPDGVELQGFVVNSHTSPFDLSVFGFDPQPIEAAPMALSAPGATGLASKAFVLPHVLERSGTINNTPFTFDTTLYATYAGGLPGTVSSNGAALKLFLYDSASGLPLAGATGAVCNPCSFDLSPSLRKLSIRIDDLITSRAGGFGNQETRDAFGVAVLDGDVANLKMQGFVVNSHTSPFDLSVFGFDPQPLASARMLPMPVQVTAGPTGLSFLVPTVIGGHYVIESKASLSDPTWAQSLNFDGDGTVQTVPGPASGGAAQFFRVNGK
jgi:hypothetical protein